MRIGRVAIFTFLSAFGVFYMVRAMAAILQPPCAVGISGVGAWLATPCGYDPNAAYWDLSCGAFFIQSAVMLASKMFSTPLSMLGENPPQSSPSRSSSESRLVSAAVVLSVGLCLTVVFGLVTLVRVAAAVGVVALVMGLLVVIAFRPKSLREIMSLAGVERDFVVTVTWFCIGSISLIASYRTWEISTGIWPAPLWVAGGTGPPGFSFLILTFAELAIISFAMAVVACSAVREV